MASQNQVKWYLAYWFQLGKKLVIDNGQEALLPQPVFQGNHYSPEFEACWQHVLKVGQQNCYLEGTVQTIEELLSERWEILPCARCDMPVPMFSIGAQEASCPCSDLPSWPNSELPRPRAAVDSDQRLLNIRDRLLTHSQNATSSAATNGNGAHPAARTPQNSQAASLPQHVPQTRKAAKE